MTSERLERLRRLLGNDLSSEVLPEVVQGIDLNKSAPEDDGKTVHASTPRKGKEKTKKQASNPREGKVPCDLTPSECQSSDYGYDVDTKGKDHGSRPGEQLEDRDDTVSDPLGRVVGAIAPLEMGFCPILAVSKYPYRFMNASTSATERIAYRYFANDAFWNRQWTVYYIYPPLALTIKPLLLVPALEATQLLEEINKEFGLNLAFPGRAEERGFHLTFADDGTPRPQFLGISSSRLAFNRMEHRVPAHDIMVKGSEFSARDEDDRSYAAFCMKMEMALQTIKNKAKAGKEKKKVQRIEQKDRWNRQLKRTQRYLGLRAKSSKFPIESDYMKTAIDWPDYVKAKEEYDKALLLATAPPKADGSKAVPHAFDGRVVFVSVDVEAFEKAHNLITEIGISTLDTNDLVDVAPGEECWINWRHRIRSRHFRIQEHSHLVNADFIHGCPDRFEKDFGESEFISIKDAPQVVASCFRPPFSAPDSVAIEGNTGVSDAKKRNIILVGHDTKTDIDYLRTMGYDVGNLSNLVEALDTSELYRALKQESQPTNLGSVLYDLGIAGWNLHNAGNDAAYTLQALIGIAFKALAPKEERLDKSLADRVGDATKEAAQRAIEENLEWNAAEGENDGGEADKVAEKPKEKPGRGGRSTTNRGTSGSRGGLAYPVPGRENPAPYARGESMNRGGWNLFPPRGRAGGRSRSEGRDREGGRKEMVVFNPW